MACFTLDAVQQAPPAVASGYCNVGEVLAVGAGVSGFTLGIVASSAPHAELVAAAASLCLKSSRCQ